MPVVTKRRIPLDRIQIDRKLSPRVGVDQAYVRELALLRSRGIEFHDPIIVIEQREGYYLLIGGENRVRAARLAGDVDISAEIHQIAADHLLWVAVEDNMQHGKALTDLERASAAARLHLEGHALDDIARLVNLPRVQLEREFRRRHGSILHSRSTAARPAPRHRERADSNDHATRASRSGLGPTVSPHADTSIAASTDATLNAVTHAECLALFLETATLADARLEATMQRVTAAWDRLRKLRV